MREFQVSVVICTRDQRSELLQTLTTLADQKTDVRWEVLVVANDCSDGTADAVSALAPGFPAPLRVVAEQRAGLSFARNRGVESADGDVLLFIDDDVSCDPGWLQEHWEAFSDPNVVGTGGRVDPVLPAGVPAWLFEFIHASQGGPTARYEFGELTRSIDPQGEIPLPFGCNMGVRRALAKALGGFRTDLGWGPPMIPGEETALFRALQSRGGRLLYCGQARVYHRIKPERVSLEHYLDWYRGMGRARVRMAEAESVGERFDHLGRDVARLVRLAIKRRGHSPTSIEGLRLRVKQERALGRIAERLRPGDAP